MSCSTVAMNHPVLLRRIVWVALSCACGVPAAGAAPADVELDAVEVKGQTLSTRDSGYSVDVMDGEEIRAKRVSRVQELYRHVPGMDIRGLGLDGVADNIMLRGFSGGGHGGDIAFSVDGIPLNEAMSHADGYADLNVIVPLEVRGMTVHKGPVSALFGNFNRAGSVALETRKGGEYREADLSLGSYGTLDAQVALGLKLRDDQHLNLAAQAFRSDGFRDQSKSWRGTLAGRWTMDVSAQTRIAVSGRLHAADADNPGYLSRERFASDPYGVEPGVQNDGAEKHFGTLRFDLQHSLDDDLRLLAFAYATKQDFSRWFTRPSGGIMRQREESYDRDVLGAGMSLNGRHRGAVPLNWVAGLETFRESTDYEYFEDLNRRRRTAPAVNDRTSVLKSLSAFSEIEAPLHALFTPTVGLRWDRFTGNCRVNGPESSTAPCGGMARQSHVSPKIGLRSEVLLGLELRASRSEGFALPSNFAKYALGAGDLDPNIFRQTEVGARWQVMPSLLLDVARYRIKSSNEIRTVAPGVYENFGSTRRDGTEVSVTWLPLDALDFQLAWTHTDSKITKNADATFIGNRVTAVPRNTVTLETNWRPLLDWQATLVWQKVGRYAVDAANTQSYSGYSLIDLRLEHSTQVAGQPTTVYAAIDNLTDRRYATAVNTIGYATGAPRMMRVGASFSF